MSAVRLIDIEVSGEHLLASAPHLRLFIMGSILLITLRFMPRGVIPEKIVRPS